MSTILEALKNSILITGLVMIMMLLIEYINIHSHGNSFRKLKNSKIKQVFLAASLGLIPGCVGGFAVVSLFTHKLLSFGALVAMMIASSGDEAFIMLAMIPKTAIIIFLALFATGVTAGILVDKFYKKEVAPFDPDHYETHENCCSPEQSKKNAVFGSSISKNLKNISRERLLIMSGIALFIIAVAVGLLEHDHSAHAHETHFEFTPAATEGGRVCIQDDVHNHNHDHDHLHSHNHSFDIFSERWINLLFAALSIFTLFLTAKANEHFIKDHLWSHVVKKHLRSIFLWTFGALIIIHFGMQFLHIEQWIAQNMFIMILLAVVIGLIPESGPHMIFITLFAGGIIPFSVLFASSIVQDGHTALPLLAESKSSFIKAKIINMAIGLIVGGVLLFAGL